MKTLTYQQSYYQKNKERINAQQKVYRLKKKEQELREHAKEAIIERANKLLYKPVIEEREVATPMEFFIFALAAGSVFYSLYFLFTFVVLPLVLWTHKAGMEWVGFLNLN